MKKKLIAAAICSLGILASGSASAIVVGGVDFGSLGATEHLETTTLAETLITGNGQTLTGYGVVDRVNGNGVYATGANKLFFSFTNYVSNNFTSVTPQGVSFTGGVVNIYLGTDFNLLNQSSATNLGIIAGMTPWAQLVGHGINGTANTLNATGIVSGPLANIAFAGAGLFDANAGFGLADVFNYWNSNGITDGAGGFADISLTTSGNALFHNPNDTCTGQAGQFCIQGTANLRGPTNVVPEPNILALIGLGLLGMGASLRKRKTT